MDTFESLGLPFPLFKAPVAHAVIHRPGNCIRCHSHVDIRFHELCYACFRTGYNDRAIDTEFGFVGLDEVRAGRTHGIPLNDLSTIAGYTLTPHPVDPMFPDEHWYHIHIDPADLIELIRTPRYHTWQGEKWLFCCQRPMQFRGSLPADMFPSGGTRLIADLTSFLDRPDWTRIADGCHGSHTYYAFTCSACGTLRYHEDCD